MERNRGQMEPRTRVSEASESKRTTQESSKLLDFAIPKQRAGLVVRLLSLASLALVRGSL